LETGLFGAGAAAVAGVVLVVVDGLLKSSALEAGTGIGLVIATSVVIGLGMSISIQRRAVRRTRMQFAVGEERQRLARELHDGVAQDLAFIACQSAHLARSAPEHELLEQIAVAAKRALDESRSVINGLSIDHSRSLACAVGARAQELAARAGLELSLDADEHIATTAEVDNAVMRILAESISNAARHAGATKLWVRLWSSADESIVVSVRDNGRGFDPGRPAARAQASGLGLRGMSDRVALVGGDLRLQSSPGAGTMVEAGFR
jgi:signal transduction histidine kinase